MLDSSVSTREWVIIILLYLFAFFSFNESINSIMLYTVVPLAFFLSVISKPYFSKNNEFRSILLLYIWIAFTALFAIDYSLAGKSLKMCLGVFMLVYIVDKLARKEVTLRWLYGLWLVYYIQMILFAYKLFVSGQFIFGQERLQDDGVFNPNALGYFTFYLTFSIYIWPDLIKSSAWKRLLRVLFILLVPWSFIIAILAGSRQILIIQVPLFLVLGYLRYFKGKVISRNYRALLLLTCFLLCIMSYHKVTDIYMNSVLHERSERDLAEDERTILFKEAINVGINNPVVGVGPGCFGKRSSLNLYSHNTYSELFANSGFIALLIFVIMELRFLIRQFKRYRVTKDIKFLEFASFGAFFILDCAFDVVYLVIWLFPFFILVAHHSEFYNKKISRIN